MENSLKNVKAHVENKCKTQKGQEKLAQTNFYVLEVYAIFGFLFIWVILTHE